MCTTLKEAHAHNHVSRRGCVHACTFNIAHTHLIFVPILVPRDAVDAHARLALHLSLVPLCLNAVTRCARMALACFKSSLLS